MKKHIYSFAALAFVLVSFTGCDKDDDSSAPKTKTELISSGSWKFSSATVGGTDASSFIQACQKDNTMVFVAAGTGTLDEGASKCNSADPQTAPFTWNFQSSETSLFVSSILFSGGSSTFTLVSLTETQLVLSQTINLGTPQNAIVTFVH